MYKNSFLYSCKKTIHPIFTKINRVHPTVTCNILTKFELNRMHRLDAIVFTHIHTHTHTCIHLRKNSINEFRRSLNVLMHQNLKVEFFHDYSNFLVWYICSESKNNHYCTSIRKNCIKSSIN